MDLPYHDESSAYRIERRRIVRGSMEFEFALIGPDGLVVAASWNPVNLKLRCDDLNAAFDVGFGAGYLAKSRLVRQS